MPKTCAIILAAGNGTRMKSSKPKVLLEVLFKPMIRWVYDSLVDCNIKDLCFVLGYKHQDILNYFDSENLSYNFVLQQERKGSAHAVLAGRNFLESNKDSHVLIMGADSPFLDKVTINNAFNSHLKENNDVTVISAEIENPFGYGRILRNKNTNNLLKITEEKDASSDVKLIKEVNSGAYWFKVNSLLEVLPKISCNNAQNEFYLTDAIGIILSNSLKANAYKTESSDVILGANDVNQLNMLNSIAKNKVIKNLLSQGVSIPFPDSLVIGSDVKIEKETTILPGCIILGNTTIGRSCVLGPNSFIKDSTIKDNSIINSCHCINQTVCPSDVLKPFSVL